MKKILTLVFLTFAVCTVHAQQVLTLSEAYQRATASHPLAEQGPLFDEAARASRAATLARLLPQIQIVGQATYQNEVTKVDIPVPGLELPTVPLEQYRFVAELNQVIYDGGATRSQAALVEAGFDSRTAQLGVDLHSVRERVRDVYFGALIAEAQIELTRNLAATMRSRVQQVEAALRNGAGLPGTLDVLRAELLKIEQQEAEARLNRNRLRDQLSILTGGEVDERLELEVPVIEEVLPEGVDRRAERKVFDSGREVADRKARLITARQLPRISLFAQGGAGRPGLNFLKDEVRPIGLVGIRFQWSIWDFGSTRNERNAARIEQSILTAQEKAFDQTLDIQRTGLIREITMYDSLIVADRSIVELRKRIAETSTKQFELGVTTPTQLVEDINAENQARQTQAIHELLLLKAKESLRQLAGF